MESTNDEYLVHYSTMSVINTDGEGNLVKSRGSLPQSEVILERELGVLKSISEINCPFFPSIISHSREDGLSITMSRVGTHDLEDILHEISADMIEELISSMIQSVEILHNQGFVHRDIKPGNFMVEYSHRRGLIEFSGMVDFGLSMRINRKQNEPGCLGGTVPYSHVTQSNKKYKESRAHPGQDWFALGRTIAHLLIGGGKEGFESLISSDKASKIVQDPIQDYWPDCPQRITDLITFSLSSDAEVESSLDELERLGRLCCDIQKSISLKNSTFESFEEAEQKIFQKKSNAQRKSGFQKHSKSRPKRHDLLIIVDSTDSMSEEIEDLKNNLGEVAKEVSSKLDIRVDIWSLGDYSREGESIDPVRPIGKRLRSGALIKSINQISSLGLQYDEAEAYEAALQDAYLTEKWSPRRNSTRTIVVIGDSYAHGWLTKKYWSKLIFESGISNHPESPNNKEYEDLISNFERRHPDVPWWERKEEEEAWKEARSNRSSHDEFSGRQAFVTRAGKKVWRPNINKAIEKCTSKRLATIHTIFAGENLVARNFMKYCSLLGKGTYTQVESGELKIALTALFAIPDSSIFKSFSEEISSTFQDTQVLNSITSFVLD